MNIIRAKAFENLDWFFGITDGLDPETQIPAQVS